MTFIERHTLTEPGQTKEPAAITHAAGSKLRVGMYDDGLFAIVDAESARTLLSSWHFLDRELRVLITTGFGDVFAWDEVAKEVCFLNVQYGTVEFVDDEVDWFLDSFLDDPEVVQKVLRKEKFEQLRRRYRSLKYHEVFLLQPWLMLGGVDRDENYGIGLCSVYLDLVGQTHSMTT